jgi:hypothetical protein
VLPNQQLGLEKDKEYFRFQPAETSDMQLSHSQMVFDFEKYPDTQKSLESGS